MAGTAKRLGNLLQDTRSRTILLFTVFLLIVAILAGLIGLQRRTSTVASKAEIGQVPGSIKSIPGGMTPTQQRIKLQVKQDVQKVKRAEQKGTSALPTILELKKLGRGERLAPAGGVGFESLARSAREGGVQKPLWFDDLKKNNCSDESLDKAIKAGASPKDLFEAGCCAAKLKGKGFSAIELKKAGFSDDELKGACYPKVAGFSDSEQPTIAAPVATPATTPDTLSGQQLNQLLQRQSAQMSEQKLQQKVSQAQSRMDSVAKAHMTGWKTPNQVFVIGKRDQQEQAGAAGLVPGEGGAGAAGSTLPSMEGMPVIKAGDIMFAVLDTAVNSDEPGPVLATIVSGKYKGAKLIGGLQPLGQKAQKIVLSFRTMSLNSVEKTISINAVAIDPNTARTALSSDTNNHYLVRYGSLFASSFLEGLGQVIQTSGSKIFVNSNGSTTIDNTGLDTAEKVMSAFGKVGQQWGQAIAPEFNRPPTIKVYSGVGLGILFTQDVTI